MTIQELNAKLRQFSAAKRAEMKLKMQLKKVTTKVDLLAKSIIRRRRY